MFEPSAAGLAALFIKNHFELRNHFAQAHRQLFPLNLSFDVPTGRQISGMKLSLERGALRLTFQEGPRTFVLTSTPEDLGNPLAQCVVQVADPRGQEVKQVRIGDLGTLALPAAFDNLHKEVLHHLQSLFPDMFGAKRPVDTAAASPGVTATPSEEDPAPADEPKNKATEAAPPDSAQGQAPTSEYRWYVVQRQNEPDLRFRGKLLIEQRSLLVRGRGKVFSVYETESKKLVALKVGVSCWMGERTTVDVVVANSLDELPAFFGYSAQAKALYQQLGIKSETVIE